MNNNLKERATEALKQSRAVKFANEKNAEKEDAEILKSLMNSRLETDVNPEGKNEVIVDGLRFRVNGDASPQRIELITQCSKDPDHGEIFTGIGCLDDLGRCIEHPPACPKCEAKSEPKKPIGDQLVDLIMEIGRA